METKSLLYGLIGFFIGGFIVSVAATTFNKPTEMTMSQMVDSLQTKKGDDFDKAFLAGMIDHHQSAVDMAKLSAKNAKHDEIKKLSADILTAQSKEITMMQSWQTNWGYKNTSSSSNMNSMGH